jgi:hypothetical protein
MHVPHPLHPHQNTNTHSRRLTCVGTKIDAKPFPNKVNQIPIKLLDTKS